MLSKARPLEELLRSAEKVAHHTQSPATAKVLEFLRTGGESWALKVLANEQIIEKVGKPSVEKSLEFKTELILSKRKYQAAERFTKLMLGIKMLKPWAEVMRFRNEIIPMIENPDWEKGYLSVHVKLRAMISNDVARMTEIEEVKQKIESFTDVMMSTVVDVKLEVAAGLNSSTGFSHYDQARILGKDDSLLTEHLMSLKLVVNGQDCWINPNPQSDIFCHG